MTGSRVAAAAAPEAEAERTLGFEVFVVVVVDDDEGGSGCVSWLSLTVRSDDRGFVASGGEAASSAVSGSRSSASATGDKGGEMGGDLNPPDPDEEDDETIEEAEVCRERGGVPAVTLEEEEGEEAWVRIEEGVRDREAPPPGEEGEEKYLPRKDEANQDWRRVLR